MEKRSCSEEVLVAWLAERVPTSWGTVEVRSDPDETLVMMTLPDVGADGSGGTKRGREVIAEFRAATRDARMAIATSAAAPWGIRLAWGARYGTDEVVFTTLSLPVMTRLRLDERRVLDGLIDGGVARSRSEALAWCVRLVGEHESEWLGDLQRAFSEVARVRAQGPRSSRADSADGGAEEGNPAEPSEPSDPSGP
ncbi:MAG: hypothetical protein ACRDYC_07695 [Acidimicrobiales bacterium]